jgi:hypothetical protein
MVEQRLPIVDGDDGTWGDILNQFLAKEHYNTGIDNAVNGGHQHITLIASDGGAGHAPIKLTSGTLLGTPETGSIELNGDKYYMTITNGTTRKRVALLDDGSGATGDTYYRDSGGNFATLAKDVDGKVLMLSGGVPTWQVVPVTTSLPISAITGGKAFAFFAG